MRYNNEALILYTTENDVRLIGDYSGNITRDTPIVSKCLTAGCENAAIRPFRLLVRTGSYCEVCTKMRTEEKKKETSMINFGVPHPMLTLEVKQKIKDTNMKNLGVEYGFKDLIIKAKIDATNEIKYGGNPMRNISVKNTLRETFMRLYGVENPSQDPDIQKRKQDTNMKKLGVQWPMQSKSCQKKSEETSLKNFGVPHPMQNAEVSERASHNAYKAYDYTFPSGRIERIQGYENFALDTLLVQGINEDDIITKRTEVPRCVYYDKEGKVHYYFVDILIQSQNKCIEVKSTWTMEKKKEEVIMKQKAMQELGFSCEIWIYDAKGNIIS